MPDYHAEYEYALRYEAGHDDLHHMLNSLTLEEKLALPTADWKAKRGAIADALQEHGRDEEAQKMRSGEVIGISQDNRVGPGHYSQLDRFGQDYLREGLETETHTDDHPDHAHEPLFTNHNLHDIHPDLVADTHYQTQQFQNEAGNDLHYDSHGWAPSHFFYTRNGHGTGFWDHDNYYGADESQRLTDLAHGYGGHRLYEGDDGMIHGFRG